MHGKVVDTLCHTPALSLGGYHDCAGRVVNWVVRPLRASPPVAGAQSRPYRAFYNAAHQWKRIGRWT
jgi:hypothetical protein